MTQVSYGCYTNYPMENYYNDKTVYKASTSCLPQDIDTSISDSISISTLPKEIGKDNTPIPCQIFHQTIKANVLSHSRSVDAISEFRSIQEADANTTSCIVNGGSIPFLPQSDDTIPHFKPQEFHETLPRANAINQLNSEPLLNEGITSLADDDTTSLINGDCHLSLSDLQSQDIDTSTVSGCASPLAEFSPIPVSDEINVTQFESRNNTASKEDITSSDHCEDSIPSDAVSCNSCELDVLPANSNTTSCSSLQNPSDDTEEHNAHSCVSPLSDGDMTSFFYFVPEETYAESIFVVINPLAL